MAKPFFDAEGYQARIDQIVGTNRDGKSILRLAWCPEVVQWALGERTPRYWITRRKTSGGWVYDQPQRWVIEKRVEPEAYATAHQATRYQVNEATGERMDLGPPPPEYYQPGWHRIAVHDVFLDRKTGEPFCCAKALEDGGRVCWGLQGEDGYRTPNDSDLELIRMAVRQMESEPYYDPYAPLSLEQLAAIEATANVETERQDAEAKAQRADVSAQFNHWWLNRRITSYGDVSVATSYARHKQRVGQLTSGFKRKGNIYIPEN